MDEREHRLVKNEAVFREINEQIEELASESLGADGHRYEFFCECSNRDCTLRVELTVAEYERIRTDPTQFVVAPGHWLPEIEEVVEQGEGYEVVRKHGPAAEVARDEDERS